MTLLEKFIVAHAKVVIYALGRVFPPTAEATEDTLAQFEEMRDLFERETERGKRSRAHLTRIVNAANDLRDEFEVFHLTGRCPFCKGEGHHMDFCKLWKIYNSAEIAINDSGWLYEEGETKPAIPTIAH